VSPGLPFPGRVPSKHLQPGERGAVLPLLLVLLLALTMLGHGILILAQREMRASLSYLHAVRGEMAAVGALRRGLEGMALGPVTLQRGGLIPVQSGWIGEGLWQGSQVRWLTREVFLLEGEGRSRGWPGSRRRGLLGWILDPVSRVGAMTAGVELGGDLILDPGAQATTSGLLTAPSEWDPSACANFAEAMDSIFWDGVLPLTAPLSMPDSLPSVPGGGIPHLGLLPGPILLSMSEGTHSPGGLLPSSGAGCPTSQGPVFVGSDSDLTLRDSRLCGLLLVGGDLRIEGTGTFQGLALVGGALSLSGVGRLEGMARVGGSVRVSDSAILSISACPVLRALTDTPQIFKPLVLPGASGFPLF